MIFIFHYRNQINKKAFISGNNLINGNISDSKKKSKKKNYSSYSSRKYNNENESSFIHEDKNKQTKKNKKNILDDCNQSFDNLISDKIQRLKKHSSKTSDNSFEKAYETNYFNNFRDGSMSKHKIYLLI